MSLKLEKAAVAFAQSIRTQFANNVNHKFVNEWKQLSVHQQRIVLALVEDAVVNGHAQAYPWLLQAYEADLSTQDNVVSLPDALIDQAAKLVAIAETGKLQMCAFTIVRNEPFFLHLWCSYYGREFGDNNLFILDNGTDDGSVEEIRRLFPNINIVSVPSEKIMNWVWCTNVVKCFQRILLHGYYMTVFSDSDEYLVPENGRGLKSYCEEFLASERDYVRAQGWGIVHDPDREPALVGLVNVLSSRHNAWRAKQYDKTLIAKVPLNWAKGSHTIYVNGQKLSNDPVSEDLSLLHLRDVDANVFFAHCMNYARLAGETYKSKSMHAASDIQQVKQYLRTRLAPWNTELREYTEERREISDLWRRSLQV